MFSRHFLQLSLIRLLKRDSICYKLININQSNILININIVRVEYILASRPYSSSAI